MHTLTNQTIELEDLLGIAARRLTDQLQEVSDWEMRFRILDAFIIDRVARARPGSPAIDWAWKRLSETSGLIDVRTLASGIGWSRKHLISRFRHEIGLPPKTVARIVRFSRVTEMLAQNDVIRWIEIAQSCGYYDQAHLIRDFREFAGSTPGEYLDRILPDGGGIAGF